MADQARDDEVTKRKKERVRLKRSKGKGDEGGVGDRGQNVRGSPIKPSGRERAAHGGSSWRWRRIIICVTLEKLLKFSAPQCPHLFNGDDKSDSDYHVSNLPCVKALTSVRSSSSSQPPA